MSNDTTTESGDAPQGRRAGLAPWPSFSALFSPMAPVLALINRLIESEPWAARKLSPFAGQVASFEVKPVVVRIEITPAGHLKRATDLAAADLTIVVPPAELAAMAMAPSRAKNHIEITGNTALAEALGELMEHLRPDLEEGLSRIFGDVLAMRIIAGANAIRDDLREGSARLAENVAEYLLEETDALIRPYETEALAAKIRVLRDDLARLEKRIERLDSGV